MNSESTERNINTPLPDTLRRWLYSKPLRLYEWQFSTFYWRLVGYWEKTKFILGKGLFSLLDWAHNRRESWSIAVEISKTIFGQVILAIVIVLALWALDTFVKPYIIASDILPSIDQQAATNFLSVVAQISGVFLALYFTAVSVVISTIYARVPSQIRELVIKEKVGDYYIRNIALTVALASLLLAKGALGFSLELLDIIIISLLIVVVILSFIPLGIRIFDFFDPARLSGYLNTELIRWFRAATPKGFQWRNPSFQAHYQRQAERVLISYRDIVHLQLTKTDIDGAVLVKLIMQPLILLQIYAKNKSYIPSDSLWFKRINRHQDWLTANCDEIDMALRSDTSLQPESLPDFMWLEKYIGEIVAHSVEKLIDYGDLRAAINILDNIQNTQSELAEYLAIDEAMYLVTLLRPIVDKVSFSDQLIIKHLGNSEKDTQVTVLGLLDVYCMELIGIILGFSKTLQRTNAQLFVNRLGKIVWNKPQSIYIEKIPREVTQQLEYLQKGLNFEHAAEGYFVSPVWYRNQIAALGIVRFIHRSVETLIKQIEIIFGDQVKHLVSEKKYLSAAQVIQRGLETCNKFNYHLSAIKSSIESLSILRCAKDIPWPTINWDDFSKKVLDIRKQLIVDYSEIAVMLAEMPDMPDRPDYFGHCFSILAEECDSALNTGNELLFTRIFPAFFVSTLAANEKLRNQLLGRTDETALVFMTEPIESLLHLSGYALIYSELDGNKYWDTVKQVWDSYFKNHHDPKELIQYIYSTINYRRTVFAILPRDILRTSWKIKLEQRLQKDGILSEIADYAPILRTHSVKPKHKSKIIQIISRGTMGTIFIEPDDVFLALYISKRSEAQGLTLPERARDFLDSIENKHHSIDVEDELI